MRTLTRVRIILVALLVLTAFPDVSGPQTAPVSGTRGQTSTLLADGRWLLVGGERAGGPVATAQIWDSRSQTATPLPSGLQQPRAWHTATVLPNGTILIVGGVGAGGSVVASPEVFDPDTQSFTVLTTTGLTPRALHTATLLTDGRVLIAGGVSPTGQTLATAELWDAQTQTAAPLSATLTSVRRIATAILLPDGTVWLSGGVDANGTPIQGGEIFDPGPQRFSALSSPPAGAQSDLAAAQVEASLPAANASSVPVDSVLALRFSAPLDVVTLSTNTVILNGPSGPEPARVISAEGGRLAFVTPDNPLRPGVTYTLSLNGLTDAGGGLLPFTAIRFSTESPHKDVPKNAVVSISPGRSVRAEAAPSKAETQSPQAAVGDDWEWKGDRRDGRPYSRWQGLPPLQASPDVTALAGQVLGLNGEPLAAVTLEVAGEAGSTPARVRTDDTGRFLLTNVPAGHNELLINGRSANGPGRTYGVFEVGVDLTDKQTTVLPYTIWMPKIDTAHAVALPSPTTGEVVVTTPRIPDLEVRMPPGAVLRDHEGQVVHDVSITPIPLDRPPFPLPQGVNVPLYFTVQPGAAYLTTSDGAGARLIYPNQGHERPGSIFDFWNYDPDEKGWHIYGQGRVAEDGRQIVPNAGVTVYEFTGAMVASPGLAPALWAAVGNLLRLGDPVDPGTGLFVMQKTDLALPDVFPIVLTRTYRPQDSTSRAFGIGSSHPYDMFLVGNINPYTYIDLILADGGRVHYARTSSGTGYADAVYEHVSTPTAFYKSRITWNASALDWKLTLKDGTVYEFPISDSAVRPSQAAVRTIRDRYGNALTLTRDGVSGNLVGISSPNGRSITFTYDTSYRIIRAQDNLGRTVTYTYDASGRLATVTDTAGGATAYTYDASHRMLTITDPKGIGYLTNVYDATGKVTSQTQADGTTYQFTYTLDANGKVTQTDVTDPRGIVHRVTVNAAGYPLTVTRALGQPEQQTTTSERQSGTNFVTAVVDPLGRRTEYGYDTMGNLASVTRLAGTPGAVTTTYTYEPTFNQVASVTDPLSHATTFAYDTSGNLTAVTDPLSHQVTRAYNAAGQPVSVTNPLGNTMQLAYSLGDLVTITDPLGNVTKRLTDEVGRPVKLTTPLGQRVRYDYNAFNQLVTITDPLGGASQLSYDPNGNLLSVTDARNNVTSYTYDNIDRAITRMDPLTRQESYAYDNNGNPTSVTDRKSQVTQTTYDALNRPTQVTYQDGSSTSYTWDAGNRLTQIVDSISGTITRTYDNLDRLTQEVTPQGTVNYAYDNADRRAITTVLGQPTVNYTYDNADRLTQITQGTAIVSIAYDNANRRTSLTLPNGVVTTYSYDAASRLTGLTYQLGTTTLGTLTYTYDANGNRTAVEGTWARTGLPQTLASATYNDANQQLTWGAQPLSSDLNGNLIGDGVNTYTWDARDRLVAINGSSTASFQYDPFGRRTRKVINGSTTDFFYDGVNPVQELSGGTVTATLLSGLRVDEYFTRTDSGSTSTQLADALASILALTDATGIVQTQYTYEAFGASTASGAPSTNAVQYAGRENDGSGLYYYRARYYAPSRQRFLSEDPLRFAGGDVNLYTYVINDPLSNSDPTGEAIPAWAAACLVGAATSAGADLLLSGRKPTLGELAGDAGVGCLSGLAGFGAGKLAAALGRAAAGAIGKALSSGANNLGQNTVYRSFNAAGEVNYVGITNNLTRRAAEQLRGKGIEIDSVPGLTNLSRSDARAVEQAVIELHGLARNNGTLLNKINSISVTNASYSSQVQRGMELLRQVGYDTLR
jgi:RHS repeat-associated protein